MPDMEGMTAGEIRTQWSRFRGTRDLLLEMEAEGWVIVRERRHFRAYCPCPPEERMNFNVPGTPRSDHTTLRRLRAERRKCPDQHDVVMLRQGRPQR